ncbi:MAG TPA: ABC transporter substrate-binding protein [Haliangiales bacterium]|nr:ABC transporter substrate-binding protein [Haliangiales bacterium]
MRIVFVVLLGLVLLALAPAAFARPTGTTTIEKANTRLRELLATKAEGEAEKKLLAKVTTELRDLFDIGDLARRALVDHWDKMTADQRTRLVDTLRSIVERNYIRQLRSNLEYAIQYKGEEPKGTDVLVKTVIQAQRKGRPFEVTVDYLLHPAGETWKVYDVTTDEVSILQNYRSQFNRIIAKEGVNGLIGRMKGKLEQAE